MLCVRRERQRQRESVWFDCVCVRRARTRARAHMQEVERENCVPELAFLVNMIAEYHARRATVRQVN